MQKLQTMDTFSQKLSKIIKNCDGFLGGNNCQQQITTSMIIFGQLLKTIKNYYDGYFKSTTFNNLQRT